MLSFVHQILIITATLLAGWPASANEEGPVPARPVISLDLSGERENLQTCQTYTLLFGHLAADSISTEEAHEFGQSFASRSLLHLRGLIKGMILKAFMEFFRKNKIAFANLPILYEYALLEFVEHLRWVPFDEKCPPVDPSGVERNLSWFTIVASFDPSVLEQIGISLTNSNDENIERGSFKISFYTNPFQNDNGDVKKNFRIEDLVAWDIFPDNTAGISLILRGFDRPDSDNGNENFDRAIYFSDTTPRLNSLSNEESDYQTQNENCNQSIPGIRCLLRENDLANAFDELKQSLSEETNSLR